MNIWNVLFISWKNERLHHHLQEQKLKEQLSTKVTINTNDYNKLKFQNKRCLTKSFTLLQPSIKILQIKKQKQDYENIKLKQSKLHIIVRENSFSDTCENTELTSFNFYWLMQW